jgi:hypothetical protein
VKRPFRTILDFVAIFTLRKIITHPKRKGLLQMVKGEEICSPPARSMSIRAKESRGQDGWAVLEMNDLLNLLSGVSLLLSCD